MRHLLLSLVVLPALLNAFSVVRNTPEPGDPEDLTQDLTFKQFVPFYVNMLELAITKKIQRHYQDSHVLCGQTDVVP
ncbi:Protein CBG22930 [Caenorhabditis briggsae]|uniref:Protein CBG22930 n=1 Tax=Caenorhabditis briggsae TaxID=6238 RepID=A8Y3M8_CAEBR|nr:Protein CBG22930 [Caenorhabditis briggsae]CAP39497.2 Protein CBG22930 [Caenorhabditis briggsae]